jgi:hypothetical protein
MTDYYSCCVFIGTFSRCKLAMFHAQAVQALSRFLIFDVVEGLP